ncbi:MAG: gamma-glutamyl-gamma-aminobutyrate hydrolase family protein [archaeon]
MILIIDNGSKFIGKFERDLKKAKVKFKVIRNDGKIDFSKLRGLKGVVLSGGPKDPFYENLSADFVALINLKVPIIGFCLGHEVIAVAFGGDVERLPRKQKKVEEVFIDKKDRIFSGLEGKTFLRESHKKHISKLPKNFKVLAHSDVCSVEIMKHKRKKIYEFQSHPKVSGTDGKVIINNF